MKSMEYYGFCSRTGRCFNPFGIKPEWVIRKAAMLRLQDLIQETEEAPF